MTDCYDYQCYRCREWGRSAERWAICWNCAEIFPAGLSNRRLNLDRMAAAARQRLAQHLTADIRRHWREMNKPLWRNAGVVSASLSAENTLEIRLESGSRLAKKLLSQMRNAQAMRIPEVDICSAWFPREAELNDNHILTLSFTECMQP